MCVYINHINHGLRNNEYTNIFSDYNFDTCESKESASLYSQGNTRTFARQLIPVCSKLIEKLTGVCFEFHLEPH